MIFFLLVICIKNLTNCVLLVFQMCNANMYLIKVYFNHCVGIFLKKEHKY